MDYSLIAVRYAKSLFLLSKEKGLVNEITSDIQMISDLCVKDNDFSLLLDSPIISPEKKKELLISAFNQKVHLFTLNFLKMIVDNKRENILTSITRNYIDLYKKDQGIVSVTLFAATALEDDFIDQIKQILIKELNTNIDLTVLTDQSIIGGFVLMMDGKLLDASIANKLKQLKKQLLS